jgi:hypothetical protein
MSLTPTAAWNDGRRSIDCRPTSSFAEVIRLSPWKRPEHDILVRAEDDAVEVRVAADDTVLESRSGIRSTYAGYELNSPWESLQVGYFIG